MAVAKISQRVAKMPPHFYILYVQWMGIKNFFIFGNTISRNVAMNYFGIIIGIITAINVTL